ncbi:MAG: hypothetical protein QOE59_4168 [Actinomycetota bacterium]|nr:hypothetical protein [Actinomycetota bacterium]
MNALAADIVAGLRILRGVGGEARFAARAGEATARVRAAGVLVARSIAWLAAAEVLLPGAVLVVITWLGARLAVAGTIGPGELVAVYGASAFLVVPVTTATETAGSLAAALAGARRVVRLLGLRPLLDPPAAPVGLPPGAPDLHDPVTGLLAPAGALTVVDAGPAAAALAARLARFPGATVPAHVAGVPVDRVELATLRRGWSTRTPRTCGSRDGCVTSSSCTEASTSGPHSTRPRRPRSSRASRTGSTSTSASAAARSRAASGSAWR